MDTDIIETNLEEPEKVYHLFGHDIRTIAGFRSTMLTSISAGLGMTLVSFLFTSDGFKSSRYGLITTSVIMTPLWLYYAQKDLADAEAVRKAQLRIRERSNEQFTILDSLESIGSDSFG